MAKKKPSGNGRDRKGRFASGNTLSIGCTHHKIISQGMQLKQALMNAVTPKDIHKIAKKLILQALTGDVIAVKELFDRLFGKAAQAISLTDEREVEQPVTVEQLREALDAAEALESEANVIQLQVNTRVG